jgi:hypothetical protein
MLLPYLDALDTNGRYSGYTKALLRLYYGSIKALLRL